MLFIASTLIQLTVTVLCVDFVKQACLSLSHVFTLDAGARVNFWLQHRQVVIKHLGVNNPH